MCPAPMNGILFWAELREVIRQPTQYFKNTKARACLLWVRATGRRRSAIVSNAYFMDFFSSYASVLNIGKSNSRQVRCVSR